MHSPHPPGSAPEPAEPDRTLKARMVLSQTFFQIPKMPPFYSGDTEVSACLWLQHKILRFCTKLVTLMY